MYRYNATSPRPEILLTELCASVPGLHVCAVRGIMARAARMARRVTGTTL